MEFLRLNWMNSSLENWRKMVTVVLKCVWHQLVLKLSYWQPGLRMYLVKRVVALGSWLQWCRKDSTFKRVQSRYDYLLEVCTLHQDYAKFSMIMDVTNLYAKLSDAHQYCVLNKWSKLVKSYWKEKFVAVDCNYWRPVKWWQFQSILWWQSVLLAQHPLVFSPPLCYFSFCQGSLGGVSSSLVWLVPLILAAGSSLSHDFVATLITAI